MKRYCTLYRLGYWGSLEAECHTQIGYSIITGQTDRLEVFDENGDTFPDLETAVRSHAADLMKVMEMPGTLARLTGALRHVASHAGDGVRRQRLIEAQGAASPKSASRRPGWSRIERGDGDP